VALATRCRDQGAVGGGEEEYAHSSHHVRGSDARADEIVFTLTPAVTAAAEELGVLNSAASVLA